MGTALSLLWAAAVRLGARLEKAKEAEEFTYATSLDANSIRLVRLVRPRWYTFRHARPRLLIATYPINDLPRYEALSYTWGAPQDGVGGYEYYDRIPILLNGSRFPIFRNLMEALGAIQLLWDFADDVQHLWIDAICINQDDLAERAAQVGIMDQIYKKASNTTVWLGRENRDTKPVVDIFKAILNVPPQDFAPYYRRFPNGTPPPDEFWHARGLPSLDDHESWAPMTRFFEHRWFSRAWVTQEVTLASKVTLLWGSQIITWDALGHIALAGWTARLGQMEALPALSRYLSGEDAEGAGTDDRVIRDALVNGLQLWSNRHRYLHRNQGCQGDSMVNEMRALTGCCIDSKRTSASWLVYFSLTNRWADATDLRDKIFSHLGLVNNIAEEDGAPPATMQALYMPTTTASDIYKEAMEMLVEEHDSLAVLMGLNDPPCSRQADLPSWVPDFSRRQGLDLMWSIRPQFQASGDPDKSQANWLGHRRIHIQGQCLRVRGTILGTVTRRSVTLADLMGPDWHKWSSDLLALDLTYQCTGESRVEAFWRTLLMNSVARTAPAEWLAAENGDMFRSYVFQCLARYCRPAAAAGDAGSVATETAGCSYLDHMRDVNELSRTDFARHMPSFQSPTALVAQMTGYPEHVLSALSDEAIREALAPCINKASEFLIGMDCSMLNRRIVFSEHGHMANAPVWAEEGDKIVILDSCPCPLVLRSCPRETSSYSLVGSAYVHGVMYGESIGQDTYWEDIRIL